MWRGTTSCRKDEGNPVRRLESLPVCRFFAEVIGAVALTATRSFEDPRRHALAAARVVAEATELGQAALNLTANAQDGAPTANAPRFRFRCSADRGIDGEVLVALSVSDAGDGIATSHCRR